MFGFLTTSSRTDSSIAIFSVRQFIDFLLRTALVVDFLEGEAQSKSAMCVESAGKVVFSRHQSQSTRQTAVLGRLVGHFASYRRMACTALTAGFGQSLAFFAIAWPVLSNATDLHNEFALSSPLGVRGQSVEWRISEDTAGDRHLFGPSCAQIATSFEKEFVVWDRTLC